MIKFFSLEAAGLADLEDISEADEVMTNFKENLVFCEGEQNTTKLRIVFDASSKSNTQFRALNECLHKGPLMLNELMGVLMRFRSREIAIIADIEKAFLQISIKEEDRDATRFLWPADVQNFEHTGELKTFRFTRVVFGLAPSPFLLAATITEHLKKEGSHQEHVRSGQHLSPGQENFEAAGFNLREFASNAKEEIDKLNQKDRLTEDRVKVLGIGWHTGADFLFKNRLVPTATKKKKKTEKSTDHNKESAEATIPKLELHALALGRENVRGKWAVPECFYCPTTNVEQIEEEVLPEVTTNASERRPAPLIQAEKWSKWQKVKKTAAFVLRFLKKKVLSKSNPESKFLKEVKTSPTSTWLNATELKLAEEYLLRQMQKSHPLSARVMQELNVFEDKQDSEAKQPIYLPKDSTEAALITQEVHEQNHHAAVNTTTAMLRQRFWMPQGKRAVASILRKSCVRCFRLRVQPYSLPPAPDLPANRVTACRPFLNVGWTISDHSELKWKLILRAKRSKSRKRYGYRCIHVWLTRAIHLEVAKDCSAEMFLHTFRRFIARRGTPESMTSDNGTNFVAAAATISKVWPTKASKQGEAEKGHEDSLERPMRAEKYKPLQRIMVSHGSSYQREPHGSGASMNQW
uniref:Integrase zinc-binding domain-containing protein n=1 Tax=Ditylenchus dipsaci TaxID=166011 RepID=A0A915DAZ0_9BILA